MIVRAAFLLAASALLGGCVSFEVAPVAETGCDAGLIGTWQARNENGETKVLRLDAACRLRGLKDGNADESTNNEIVDIRTFDLDGQHYIVAAEGTPNEVRDSDGKLVETWPATRVDLFRYRRDGDSLNVWTADPAVAATLVSPGIAVRSDAIIDTKTGKPMAGMLRDNILLRGKREDLAALLRTRGDALYLDMRPDKALTLQRLPEKTTP